MNIRDPSSGMLSHNSGTRVADVTGFPARSQSVTAPTVRCGKRFTLTGRNRTRDFRPV